MAEAVLPEGIRLHVEDAGSGAPALVFIHGVTMSGAFFRHQLRDLPKRIRVVIPDLRGHGRSDKTPSGHTVRTYARDLKDLLEILGVERPVLVGWSMGAMVALEYIRSFGQRGLAGLVIVDQPPSDFAWPGYQFGGMTAENLGHLVEGLQTEQRRVACELAEQMLHEPSPVETGWMIEEMLNVPPTVASTIFVNQTLQDYRADYGEIDLPSLVLFGGDPKLTLPEAGAYITRHLQDASFHLFPHSSHCPFLEEPDEFNRVLLDFVRSIPPQRR